MSTFPFIPLIGFATAPMLVGILPQTYGHGVKVSQYLLLCVGVALATGVLPWCHLVGHPRGTGCIIYPAQCNAPISYALLAGNTAILAEGCSALYPARALSMLTDYSPPILLVNGAELSSYLITAEATLMGNIARGPVRSSARAESGCTGMRLCKTKSRLASM